MSEAMPELGDYWVMKTNKLTGALVLDASMSFVAYKRDNGKRSVITKELFLNLYEFSHHASSRNEEKTIL